jgi:hypothetical protein
VVDAVGVVVRAAATFNFTVALPEDLGRSRQATAKAAADATAAAATAVASAKAETASAAALAVAAATAAASAADDADAAAAAARAAWAIAAEASARHSLAVNLAADTAAASNGDRDDFDELVADLCRARAAVRGRRTDDGSKDDDADAGDDAAKDAMSSALSALLKHEDVYPALCGATWKLCNSGALDTTLEQPLVQCWHTSKGTVVLQRQDEGGWIFVQGYVRDVYARCNWLVGWLVG